MFVCFISFWVMPPMDELIQFVCEIAVIWWNLYLCSSKLSSLIILIFVSTCVCWKLCGQNMFLQDMCILSKQMISNFFQLYHYCNLCDQILFICNLHTLCDILWWLWILFFVCDWMHKYEFAFSLACWHLIQMLL